MASGSEWFVIIINAVISYYKSNTLIINVFNVR